jgi:hypothetical protein
MNYQQKKVGEIKEELVALGVAEESLEGLKKPDLVKLHSSYYTSEEEELQDALKEAVVEENIIEEDVEKVPVPSDPEWQDFVISKFTKDELIDGKHPTVNGLRRVVELLIGEIVASGPVEVRQPPLFGRDDPGRATVTYEVVVLPHYGVSDMKTFKALGGSFHGNTDNTYAIFPEAIAETRAEARALRKALKIHTAASEELTNNDPKEFMQNYLANTEIDEDQTGPITDMQKTTIQLLCKRLNIDENKFINLGQQHYDALEEISRPTAAIMIQQLNGYQNSGEHNIEIPEEIRKT